MEKTLIQRRLEAQALEIPELAANPQTKPLIGWVSEALAASYAELESGRADLYHDFVDRIFPEPEGRAFPAYAIARARPDDAKAEISADWARKVERTPVYFSPVRPLTLLNTDVRYQVVCNTIDEYLDGQKIKSATMDTPLPTGCMCLGLELGADVDRLDGLTLLFDGLPEMKDPLVRLLRCRCNGMPIELTPGWPAHKDGREPFPDAECLRLERIKNQILGKYEPKVFYLQQCAIPETDTCPTRLQTILPGPVKEMSLLWLEILFPDGFTPDELTAIQIHTNVFPVWNARRYCQRGIYPDGAAAIPLPGDEESGSNLFLGMERVWSDRHDFFLPGELAESGKPAYTVQSGHLGAFSSRELARRTDALLQMMETYGICDFAGFAAEHAYDMGYENVAEVLGQLKKNIDALQKQLAYVPAKAKGHKYYLRLKDAGDELVYYDFLITQGGLTTGQLWPYELNLIAEDRESLSLKNARLLRPPVGGRDALSLSERETLIRRLLSDSFHHNEII